MEIKKRYVSWEEVDELVNILYENIIESGILFDSINGLARGGLTPAVMLSHKLDIPYDSFGNTLVVDDICDSGETLHSLTQSEYPICIAVLHYKPHTSMIEPGFYACKFESDDWIVYPWEEKDSKTIQDYKV